MSESMRCKVCGGAFEFGGIGRRPTMCHECRKIPASKRGKSEVENQPRKATGKQAAYVLRGSMPEEPQPQLDVPRRRENRYPLFRNAGPSHDMGECSRCWYRPRFEGDRCHMLKPDWKTTCEFFSETEQWRPRKAFD